MQQKIYGGQKVENKTMTKIKLKNNNILKCTDKKKEKIVKLKIQTRKSEDGN